MSDMSLFILTLDLNKPLMDLPWVDLYQALQLTQISNNNPKTKKKITKIIKI